MRSITAAILNMDFLNEPFSLSRGPTNKQTGPLLESPSAYISSLNKKHPVMVFTYKMGKVVQNGQVENYLNKIDQNFAVLYLDMIGDQGRCIEEELSKMTKQTEPPWIFILGKQRPLKQFLASFYDGMIETWLRDPEFTYNYDLIIIGESPVALSAAKATLNHKRRVLVCPVEDGFNTAFPGNLFGFLRTTVNLDQKPKNRWKRAVNSSNKLSKQTSKKIFRALRTMGVEFIPGPVTFSSSHTIQGEIQNSAATGLNFLLVCEKESLREKDDLKVTVEDLLKSHRLPEDTLVLGKSLFAVEVATLLHLLGVSVTLMYPGRILKHFDQECVQKMLDILVESGVRVECCVVDQISTSDGKIKSVIGYHPSTGKEFREEYDTLVNATEKKFNYHSLNLDEIGVKMDKKDSNIVCNDRDQTSLRNIYAIGPIVHGRPHEATVTDTAGRILIERLFGMKETLMNYTYLPTVVHGIVEYGSIGLSEESAIETYGKENVMIYKSTYKSFDHMLDENLKENFVKLVCVSPNKRVVGMHVLGENVEDMIIGFTIALRKKLTKAVLDATFGIEMTNIFEVTRLK